MSNKFIVDTSRGPRAFGPYSQAVSFGPYVFTSALLPVEPETGNPSRGGIATQAELAINNLLGVLLSCGLSHEHVVKTTLYLRNLNDLEVVDRVYGKIFDFAAPARTVVEVQRLEHDVLIAIEAVAAAPSSLDKLAHKVPNPSVAEDPQTDMGAAPSVSTDDDDDKNDAALEDAEKSLIN